MTGPDRSAADLLRTAAGLISERGHAKDVILAMKTVAEQLDDQS